MTVALLAPVPEEHLLSGQVVCDTQGKVAFGSKNWELFYRLQGVISAGGGCEALIYASGAAQPISPPMVTWRATFTGFVQSKGGAHPAGLQFRPPTTQKYALDNQGSWAVFWEVVELTQLPKIQWIKVSQLRGFEKPNKYLTNFLPKGPTLVQEPSVLSGASTLKVVPG